jgi:hypothetical protein
MYPHKIVILSEALGSRTMKHRGLKARFTRATTDESGLQPSMFYRYSNHQLLLQPIPRRCILAREVRPKRLTRLIVLVPLGNLR